MTNIDLVAEDIITNKIIIIRGRKVMLDKDIALLYNVKPIVLRQQVKRNIERFPEDFMFILTESEIQIMVSQNVIPSKKYFGGSLPYVFTEQGIAMLSSVLTSKRSISVNIQIMRTFAKIREIMSSNSELRNKIEEMEKKFNSKFEIVFKAIKQLLSEPEAEPDNKFKIGFN
jgi:hypothetical protein